MLFYSSQHLISILVSLKMQCIVLSKFTTLKTWTFILAQVQMAGGTSSFVPIRCDAESGTWKFDINELANAITPNTRILLLNTPHNPTGKVFTLDELHQIRDVLLKHPQVICVCDEVYEKLVYDGKQHHRMAMLPVSNKNFP